MSHCVNQCQPADDKEKKKQDHAFHSKQLLDLVASHLAVAPEVGKVKFQAEII